MTNKNLEITPQTLVGDFLNSYPNLENELVEISPVFQKLKNPILRKTVARVATLKQAAVIANISVGELINKLRSAAGQIETEIVREIKTKIQKPDWVKKENIKFEYDVSLDLENGIHPAAKVTKEVLRLNPGEIYLIISPFIPAPLLKILEEKGFAVFTETISENTFYNYVKIKQ